MATPPGPPFEVYWEDGFRKSLERLGITWETFDALGKFGVDFLLQTDPFEPDATFQIPGTGHRYLHTRFRFPDLPAMLIAYEVNEQTVTVKGAESIWDSDLFDETAF
jgi:hypothetical protein